MVRQQVSKLENEARLLMHVTNQCVERLEVVEGMLTKLLEAVHQLQGRDDQRWAAGGAEKGP